MPCGEDMCVLSHDFAVSMQYVSMFNYAGGAWASTKRLGTCLVVKPCALCVISL